MVPSCEAVLPTTLVPKQLNFNKKKAAHKVMKLFCKKKKSLYDEAKLCQTAVIMQALSLFFIWS
jgi:hypothetical protein